MKTKLEIIEETVEAYSDPSNRAVGYITKSGCDYLNPETGKMCAVGRCMIDPPTNDSRWVAEVDLQTNGGLDVLLKEEYRGHGISFWRALQRLHDLPQHFLGPGYSEEGRAYILELKTKYA